MWPNFKLSVSLLVFFGYPYIVYEGLASGLAWLVPLAVAGFLVGRAASVKEQALYRYYLLLGMLFVLGAIVLPALTAKMLPVSAHLGLAALFLMSLKNNSSVAERFVRLEYPIFPEGVAQYCRQITWCWVVFFGLNALICTLIALLSTDSFWSFYNGVIVFVEMAFLFSAEYLWRQWRFPGLDAPSPVRSIKTMIKNGRHVWNDIHHF